MAVPQFQPMSIGEILDRTFRLYREHFVRYLAIVAVVQVPLSLLLIVVQQGMLRASIGRSVPDLEMVAYFGIGVLVTVFLLILGQSLSSAALIRSISASYLGEDVTVGEAYRFVLPKLVTIVVAGTLVFLAILAGVLMIVVPGIIFWMWFCLTAQVVVIEDVRATRAMSRSKWLVSGDLGKVFLVGLLVFVLTLIISLIFSWVGALIGRWAAGAPTAASASGMPQINPTIELIKQLVTLVGEVLVRPIGAAAMILLYYDLRIRKEGFDLEMLAARMGHEKAASDAFGPRPPLP